MARLQFGIEVEIDAPAALVWPVMRDIERWSEWTPTVRRIRRLDTGPLAVGSRAIVYQPKLLPAKWQITELDDSRRTFTWITVAPGMRLEAKHSVAEVAGGSKAALSLQFCGLLGPLFALLTANINDRYLALESAGLKERCERGTVAGMTF